MSSDFDTNFQTSLKLILTNYSDGVYSDRNVKIHSTVVRQAHQPAASIPELVEGDEETVMHWRFTELQGECEAMTGVKITYAKITHSTGLPPTTLSGISTGRSKRVDFRTLNTLLGYFGGILGRPLTTSDLLEYRPDA